MPTDCLGYTVQARTGPFTLTRANGYAEWTIWMYGVVLSQGSERLMHDQFERYVW